MKMKRSNWATACVVGCAAIMTLTSVPVAATELPEETLYGAVEEAGSVEALTVAAPNDRRSYLESFVSRLYEKCLGRTARRDEINFWAQRLEDGSSSGADVAVGFIFSEEYKRKKTSDTDYVDMLYRTILDRERKGSEADSWLRYLNRGASREWVLAGFLNSEEFTRICRHYQVNRGTYVSHDVQDMNLDVTSFVIRLYENCLGRRPAPYEQGLKDWVGWLLDGSQSGCDVAWGFLNSEELNRKGLGEQEYLTLLYRSLMGREPDQSGMNTWLGEYEKGVSKRYVTQGFLYSTEFNRLCRQYGIRQGTFELTEARDRYPKISAFAKGFYQSCLQRTPRGNELNDWVEVLADGSFTSLDMVNGFFFSNEYARRNRSNYDFVKDCYIALLGRTGTESERNDWVVRLDQGWSREAVLAFMANSAEYQRKCSTAGIVYEAAPAVEIPDDGNTGSGGGSSSGGESETKPVEPEEPDIHTHTWTDLGTDIHMDWSGAAQEDTGYTSNAEDVTSINTCRNCGYFLGRDESLLAERLWEHIESSDCPGSYTLVPVTAVYHLYECSECGAYKRGDFAYYEYPAYPNGNFTLPPSYIHLTEDQIQELGL